MLTFRMKVKPHPFSFPDENGKTNEGIRFEFNDFDGTHEETLMLRQAGEAVEGVHRSPLYALQSIPPEGEMVDVEFSIRTEKNQTAQEGRRDRVKFRRGLYITAVRPADAAAGSANGRGERAGAGAGRSGSSS